ncbi:hypothetical protein K2X33_04445 [bacterium]|nr:hypothetical protein [bacterium]
MSRKTAFRFFAFFLLLAGTANAAAQRLDDRYFMVVFGYEGPGNRAVDSHTFASFYSGDALMRRQTRNPATISWLPATGVVRPIRREAGRNFSLEETLAIARERGYEVRAYGPYEITRDLYRRALDRIDYLNSGRVDYRMTAAGLFMPNVLNCISAVSGVLGPLNTGTLWGFAASQKVTQYLAKEVYSYPNVNYDVADAIALRYMTVRY